MTFLLFLFIIGIAVFRQNGVEAALDAVAFITLVFACIVLHEFGHILMARLFGIKTRDVTLFPIGGVANIERMPDKPYQELLVALAGPLVNLCIFLAVTLALSQNLRDLDIEKINDSATSLALRIAVANLILMIFNLLPAFPMDGGRALRALLAMWIAKSKATKIAATIGQGLALLMGFIGFFGNPTLILIAAFIFMAAGSEAETAIFHDITHDLTIRDAMIDTPAQLSPRDTIRMAIDRLQGSTDNEFIVMDKAHHEMGIITRDMLLLSLASHNDETQISSLMSRPESMLYENDPLDKALTIFERGNDQALMVKDMNNDITGLISRAAIAQTILIKTARPDWKFYRGGILAKSLPRTNRDQQAASSLP